MTWGTFTPPYAPIPGTEDKPEYKILQADFGDGYTQATADGLNNVRRVLTVAWDGLTVAEANAIINFFTIRQGCQPFYYTPSNEATPVKWTCKDHSLVRGQGGLRKVSATFRQSFALES